MSRRLVLDPHNASFKDLAPVSRVLIDGGIIACPTETFYALAATVDSHQALDRIAQLKGEGARDNKPFLIMADQKARVLCYAREIPKEAEALMDRFWPGPLTLLFSALNGLYPRLVGDSRTVALRVEGLPLVRRLVRMTDRGLTGTSANPAGQPPATSPDEVENYFGDQVDLILDCGPTPGGRPSTIADVTAWPPRVIRRGAIDIGQI